MTMRCGRVGMESQLLNIGHQMLCISEDHTIANQMSTTNHGKTCTLVFQGLECFGFVHSNP